MTTARDIITAALQDLSAIAIDETPTAIEANNALTYLNRMINTWNAQEFMIYTVQNQIFPYVSGQQIYTMGVGGNFNTTAYPETIEKAYTVDPQGNNYAMQVATNFDEFSDIITQYTQSQLPNLLYNDNNYPLANLTFWPIPNNTGWSVKLWWWQALTSFATLDTVVSLPPGYEEALEFNLAGRLAPKYEKSISPELAAGMADSLSIIKRKNTRIQTLKYDPTLTTRGRVFNWLTGM